MNFAPRTPYFQEFHAVLREDALGLQMRPLNGLAVVMGLKRSEGEKCEDDEMMAAERAGVRVGSILVAVNGSNAGLFDSAIPKVKAAGRPVTLGFRYLHGVDDSAEIKFKFRYSAT